MTDLNQLANNIYEQNKAVGWWDDPNRCVYQTLQLVSTELAEATEGERKNLMDDHLPERRMGEVELADALIRVLDLGGRYGWNYTGNIKAPSPHPLFMDMTTVGGMHLICNVALVHLTKAVAWGNSYSDGYTKLIDTIIATANSQGYDLFGALIEKLEYNKKRADHKRENRAKDGGKKF